MKGTFKISLLSQEEVQKQFPTGGSLAQQSMAFTLQSAIDRDFSLAKVSSKHEMSYSSAELDDVSEALTAHLGGEPLTILEIGHPDCYSVYLAYKKTSDIIELF